MMTHTLQMRLSASVALLLLGACAGQPGGRPAFATAPTTAIRASGETVPVATANADAADDPAIWARADGAAFDFGGKRVDGLILGTDKKAGLYVFGLDGQALQFLPDGLLNNVDLRSDGDGFVAAASDRGRMGVALYRYSGSGQLAPAGFLRSDVAEPYGMCMGLQGDTLVAVLISKEGTIVQYALHGAADGTLTGTEQRRMRIATQSEGCVVDEAGGYLYVGEEDVGIWRFIWGAEPATAEKVAAVGDGSLVADVEGLTILTLDGERLLIASSQGDNAFSVYRLGIATKMPVYAGRFRVVADGGVDGVSGTDGVDARGGRIGAYPDGLVVTQDDQNEGGPQNFKLIDARNLRAVIAN